MTKAPDRLHKLHGNTRAVIAQVYAAHFSAANLQCKALHDLWSEREESCNSTSANQGLIVVRGRPERMDSGWLNLGEPVSAPTGGSKVLITVRPAPMLHAPNRPLRTRAVVIAASRDLTIPTICVDG